jgi:hypothetical protein
VKRLENFRAVEAFWPGLRCVRADFFEKGRTENRWRGLYLTVEGTAEKIVEHGLAKQAQIDSLPPCGVKGDLRRTPRGTYQVRKHWSDVRLNGASHTDASDMAARIGVVLDVYPSPPDAPAEKPATRPYRHFAGLRVKWSTDGTVIRPDWESLQRMVSVARRAGALGGAA